MNTEQQRVVLERYYECRNRHDLQGALACLADQFTIEFANGPTLNKQQASQALGWDIGTRGRANWTISEVTGGKISVEGTETNEFLDLLGIPAIAFQSVYSFTSDGLICKQHYSAQWGDISIPDAMAPAVVWASEHSPQELADVYPEGQMVYTEETARRWVALLGAWRTATAK